jgi:hypothetical protein
MLFAVIGVLEHSRMYLLYKVSKGFIKLGVLYSEEFIQCIHKRQYKHDQVCFLKTFDTINIERATAFPSLIFARCANLALKKTITVLAFGLTTIALASELHSHFSNFSHKFFGIVSNRFCLGVGNDGFGLPLYLVVEMYCTLLYLRRCPSSARCQVTVTLCLGPHGLNEVSVKNDGTA